MHSLIIVVAAQHSSLYVCVCVLCERSKLCYTFFMLPQQRLARNIRLPVDGSGWSFSYATAFCPMQKQKNVEKKNKMVGRTSGRTIRQKKKKEKKGKRQKYDGAWGNKVDLNYSKNAIVICKMCSELRRAQTGEDEDVDNARCDLRWK